MCNPENGIKGGGSMVQQKHTKLRLYLDKNGIKHKEVAKAMGMTTNRFSQKINRNKSDFTLQEASLLCYILDLNMNEFFITLMSRKRELIKF